MPVSGNQAPADHRGRASRLDRIGRGLLSSPSMQRPPATDTSEIKRSFADVFGPGGKLHVVRAPGRVNLIGEHTDYNDGFVFPMAIEPCVLLACRSRDDGAVRLASTAFPGEVVEFSVQAKVTRGEPSWANYSRGVAAELLG